MAELPPLDNSHLPVRLTLDDYLLLDGAGAFADYAKTTESDTASASAVTIAGLTVDTTML